MGDNFYKNSFFLILSNLTTGVLGFIFSIILSRLLGAEGMALYGLVMPLYNLFICLMCGGIITAISKLSAVYYDNHDYYNLRKTIRTTFSLNIVWALVVAILVFLFAPQIATYIIKDNRTILALRIITPAMIFICLSNIIKGFFYGTSQILVPAIIDIGEKALRVFIILALLSHFGVKSLETSVALAYTALVIGEFVSLTLLYIYYKRYVHPLKGSCIYKESRAQLAFNVLVISFPLCLNGLSTTALDTLATLILPRRLVAAGLEYSSALNAIGKFSGMSMNIVMFPMLVIGSLITLLIPNLSKLMNKKDYFLASNRIKEVLKIAMILGLCTLSIALNMPEDLGYMFFKRRDLGQYIAFAALCPPITFVANATVGILNGLGKQNLILRNSIMISCLDLVFLYILAGIPEINVYAFGISILTSSILMLILNLKEINKSIALNINIMNFIYVVLLGILCFFTLKTCIASFPSVPKPFFIILGFAFAPLARINLMSKKH